MFYMKGFVLSCVLVCALQFARMHVFFFFFLTLPKIMVVPYLFFEMIFYAVLHHLTVSLHHITLSIHEVSFPHCSCSKLLRHCLWYRLVQLLCIVCYNQNL